jgi:hypothetical protein
MIAERFAGHSGVKYVRSLGCERVQFKNQVCHPELRELPAKSEPFCESKHARILLQHERGQPSQSTAAAGLSATISMVLERASTRAVAGNSDISFSAF